MHDGLQPNTTTNIGSPIDADFATFRDVNLRSLAIILVLTGELDVLELVQHFRHPGCGLGKHGFHWNTHHKSYMLFQFLYHTSLTHSSADSAEHASHHMTAPHHSTGPASQEGQLLMEPHSPFKCDMCA